MTERLKALSDAGVSIWLDDLSRERIETGNLADLVKNKSVVGVTTNPTIFASAISEGERYDDEVRSLVADGGAVSYEGLGAYKYLVHLELDDAPHDRYRQSVEELIEYDRRRGAALVETLERFLADRGSVAASARALYIHPNTVRQRLERIERVTGLELAKEDLLSLELALKLARLHDAGGTRSSRER